MKLSARNVLKGKVVDVDRGKVTAIVRVDIGGRPRAPQRQQRDDASERGNDR